MNTWTGQKNNYCREKKGAGVLTSDDNRCGRDGAAFQIGWSGDGYQGRAMGTEMQNAENQGGWMVQVGVRTSARALERGRAYRDAKQTKG